MSKPRDYPACGPYEPKPDKLSVQSAEAWLRHRARDCFTGEHAAVLVAEVVRLREELHDEKQGALSLGENTALRQRVAELEAERIATDPTGPAGETWIELWARKDAVIERLREERDAAREACRKVRET